MATEPNSTGDGGTSSGDNTGSGSASNSNTDDFVPKEEFEKVNRANNWAQSQFKTWKAKAEELQAQLDSLSSGDKGKSSERLAQAETRIKELEAERDGFAGKLRDITVKSEVFKMAKGKIREDALEAFWQLEGSKFGEVELSGEKKIGLVEAPYSSFDDYLGDLSKRHGFLIANNRTPGTGEPTKGDDGPTGTTVSMQSLEKLSERERATQFTKNPELRMKWLKHKGLVP